MGNGSGLKWILSGNVRWRSRSIISLSLSLRPVEERCTRVEYRLGFF